MKKAENDNVANINKELLYFNRQMIWPAQFGVDKKKVNKITHAQANFSNNFVFTLGTNSEESKNSNQNWRSHYNVVLAVLWNKNIVIVE